MIASYHSQWHKDAFDERADIVAYLRRQLKRAGIAEAFAREIEYGKHLEKR